MEGRGTPSRGGIHSSPLPSTQRRADPLLFPLSFSAQASNHSILLLHEHKRTHFPARSPIFDFSVSGEGLLLSTQKLGPPVQRREERRVSTTEGAKATRFAAASGEGPWYGTKRRGSRSPPRAQRPIVGRAGPRKEVGEGEEKKGRPRRPQRSPRPPPSPLLLGADPPPSELVRPPTSDGPAGRGEGQIASLFLGSTHHERRRTNEQPPSSTRFP